MGIIPGSVKEVSSINVIVVMYMIKNPIHNMRLALMMIGKIKYIYKLKHKKKIMYRLMVMEESVVGPVISLPLRKNLFFDGHN